ncbi:CPXCG motif-containing cysteine-rich protein [Kaarinaea lacus]
MLEEISVFCPYCGETFETTVDLSAGDQIYIEDCYVCCRPIQFDIRTANYELVSVSTYTSD